MTLAEQLAPGLSEEEVLAQGFKLLTEQLGLKAARYYFYYDLDYTSDFVSEYFNLNNLETA